MRLRTLLLAAFLASIAAPIHWTSPAKAGSELQGFSPERLDRIAPVMSEQIAKGTFPGDVALIARNGQIVYLEAHGFVDAA